MDPQRCLFFFQKVLLGSYNRTWPAYSNPSNYFSVCKPVVFHYITGYQCPCSSKTSFAVNGDGPFSVLTDVQEPSHDVVTGCAAIYEEEVIVLEASVCEALCLINLFVQPHNCSHIMLFEIRKVGFRGVKRITIFNFAFRMWSTKC